MKKEVKIGIYAVIILLCAWAGLRFLSGLDVFGRTRNYTAHYEQVNGLQDAATVVISEIMAKVQLPFAISTPVPASDFSAASQ